MHTVIDQNDTFRKFDFSSVISPEDNKEAIGIIKNIIASGNYFTNSPKYQTQTLSDIMNLTKTNTEQNEKMKKLRVVKTSEVASTSSRKDVSRPQTTNRVKPMSVRSSLQMPQTSSRDARSTV